MKLIRRFLNHVLSGDEGVSTVEYAVMLAMIVLIAIGAIINAGNVHRAFWLDTANQLGQVTQSGGSL